MGRKANQKKSRSAKKSQNTSMEDLLLSEGHYENIVQNRYSPDSLKSLRKELKEAIEKIYSRYLEQFCIRKESRIHYQDPTYPISNEELAIEKNYCNELTQKVKQLVHLDSLHDIFFRFRKSIFSFMSKIYSALQELKNSDPCLQLACLAEAYFVIENSSRELGKVTSGIFDQKLSHVTCENVTKLAFLEHVVKNFSEMIKSFHNLEVCDVVKNVIKMEQELLELGDRSNHLAEHIKSQKSQFLNPLPISNYCIDDIVNYINGDIRVTERRNNKSRRVSKASTAETSGSPFDRRSRDDVWKSLENNKFPTALDKEIEEFQVILESTKPLNHKLKPSLSEEWIKKIRSEILKKN